MQHHLTPWSKGPPTTSTGSNEDIHLAKPSMEMLALCTRWVSLERTFLARWRLAVQTAASNGLGYSDRSNQRLRCSCAHSYWSLKDYRVRDDPKFRSHPPNNVELDMPWTRSCLLAKSQKTFQTCGQLGRTRGATSLPHLKRVRGYYHACGPEPDANTRPLPFPLRTRNLSNVHSNRSPSSSSFLVLLWISDSKLATDVPALIGCTGLAIPHLGISMGHRAERRLAEMQKSSKAEWRAPSRSHPIGSLEWRLGRW